MAPSGKIEDSVRNSGAASDSLALGLVALELRRPVDMWLTMRSAITRRPCDSSAEVGPLAEPAVDLGVVLGVEPGVRAVERAEERQHVHTVEDVPEALGQHPGQPGEVPTEPVGVRDQLGTPGVASPGARGRSAAVLASQPSWTASWWN